MPSGTLTEPLEADACATFVEPLSTAYPSEPEPPVIVIMYVAFVPSFAVWTAESLIVEALPWQPVQATVWVGCAYAAVANPRTVPNVASAATANVSLVFTRASSRFPGRPWSLRPHPNLMR